MVHQQRGGLDGVVEYFWYVHGGGSRASPRNRSGGRHGRSAGDFPTGRDRGIGMPPENLSRCNNCDRISVASPAGSRVGVSGRPAARSIDPAAPPSSLAARRRRSHMAKMPPATASARRTRSVGQIRAKRSPALEFSPPDGGVLDRSAGAIDTRECTVARPWRVTAPGRGRNVQATGEERDSLLRRLLLRVS